MVEGYQIQFFEPPLIRVFDLNSFGFDKKILTWFIVLPIVIMNKLLVYYFDYCLRAITAL